MICSWGGPKGVELLDMASRKCQQIGLVRAKLRLRGLNVVVESEGGAHFALQYVSLAFEIKYALEMELQDVNYEVEGGARGIVVLVRFVEFEGTPCDAVNSMADYVNSFLYFHSRGFSL